MLFSPLRFAKKFSTSFSLLYRKFFAECTKLTFLFRVCLALSLHLSLTGKTPEGLGCRLHESQPTRSKIPFSKLFLFVFAVCYRPADNVFRRQRVRVVAEDAEVGDFLRVW